MLDLGLPDVDGVQVLGMIREVSAVPVIVATARDDEAEMVRVLDRGADDYVVKPFSAEQLDARVRAVLRRSTSARRRSRRSPSAACWSTGRPGSATLDGRPLDLTRMEFDLLAYLAGRAGRVVSQAAADGRGVAAAVRRGGQDRRRAPVLAAAQARARPRPSRATCRPSAGSG